MVHPEYVTDGTAEYVRALFPKEFKGVCVEVGANDPFWISNSWIFEQEGWLTYCIEPNPHCIPALKKHRKNVIEFACGSSSVDDVDFYIYETDKAGPNHLKRPTWTGEGSYTGLIKHENAVGFIKETIKVKVRTLDFILGWNWLPINNIDYISIDVEGTEMDVLKGLSLIRWTPRVIVVENILQDVDQHGWLASYGYSCINRIGVSDIYRKNF